MRKTTDGCPGQVCLKVPDEVRCEFKAACAIQGKTMSEVGLQLIEGWLARASKTK
jgi:hypothetical protein